ncbi:homeobox-DDT domain protein RLT2-like isoform X1 [Musa acuminata AAA Group]|uniref:homeobox-DDT domain protein RLT2-like isoform X1 n=1 Tax=Musa acuminata AAA Group TaxID=214697 RepID=UPI0031E25E84
MEHGEGSNVKRPPAVGLTVKRQMKSPSQVQILEEAFAVESNPSALMKEDLARRTGLEYTQVQYWFGNRRFLDKHGPRTNTPRRDRHGPLWEFNPDRTSSMSPVTVARAGPAPNGSVYSAETLPMMRPAGQYTVNPGLVPILPCVPLATQSQLLPVSQELQWMITHVENKLGHPLRADGPILGTEFDALPPGAFGFALVNAEQKRASHPYDGKEIEQPKLESVKEPAFMLRLEYGDVHALEAEAPNAVHEFQFFPIQPSWLQKCEDVNQTGVPKSSVNTSHNVSDDCHAVTPDAERANLFPSSSKVVFQDDSYYKTEKTQVHPSGSYGVNENQQLDHARTPAAATSEEVNQKNCYPTIQNLRKKDKSCVLHHCYDCYKYLVMSQERSETTSVDARQTGYFSNVDHSRRPLVAKWSEKEGQVVYIMDYTGTTPSMSSGTNSTLSSGCDEASKNVGGRVDGKPMEVVNVDVEKDCTDSKSMEVN